MFGNVGEFFSDIIEFHRPDDFKVTASCWNLDQDIKNLGGYTYKKSNSQNLEAFSLTIQSSKYTYYLEENIGGKQDVGFRIVARGAVPSALPMSEVQSTITEGAANLHWDSTVGRIYQLQYSDSLDNPNWIDIGQQIYGSGGTDFFTIPVNTTAEKNRFYRVVDFD